MRQDRPLHDPSRTLARAVLGLLVLWAVLTSAYGVIELVDTVHVARMYQGRSDGSWLSLETNSAIFLGWVASFSLLFLSAVLGIVLLAVVEASLSRALAFLGLLAAAVVGPYELSQRLNTNEDIPDGVLSAQVVTWLAFPVAALLVLTVAWRLLRPAALAGRRAAQASMASASTS